MKKYRSNTTKLYLYLNPKEPLVGVGGRSNPAGSVCMVIPMSETPYTVGIQQIPQNPLSLLTQTS